MAEITFIDVLELLEKTTGTNEKIDILQKNKDVPHLVDYLDYATNPKITFGIANYEFTGTSINVTVDKNSTWESFKSVLDQLASRELTGNKAKLVLDTAIACANMQEKRWFEKCLLKDLSCIGLGLRLLEKGFGEIKKFRLMLAAPEDELDKVEDGPGWLDKKANGVRTVIIVEGGKVIVIFGGRNGLVAENFYFIVEEIEALIAKLSDALMDGPHPIPFILNCVFDGEIHVNDSLEDTMSLYGFKYRDKSEFIGAKGKLKEKAWADYQADEERINKFKADAKFTIFDVIPINNWETQSYDKILDERKKDLEIVQGAINKTGLKRIEIIPSKWVPNKAGGVEEAQKWIALNFEGGVYKKSNGIYEWKRSRNWVKIKEVCDFEIQFTHYEIQKEKHNPDGTIKPAMVGAVFGIGEDGNEYKVGTGKAMDEKTRQHMLENWETDYKDKIGTCSAQRPSGKGKYICPRLDVIRKDRNSLKD